MTRKTVSLLLTLVLALSACAFIPAASKAEAMPMYVYTENGGTLNVRSTPEKLRDNSNVIGELKYGEMVMVEFINSTGWAVILYKDGEAYVQAHFLVDNPPAPRPAPTPRQKEEEEKRREQEKLNSELTSEREVTDPFYIAVRSTRTSGWISFRVGPSKITTRITTFPDGKELIVLGETTNWYRARDPETQKIGYIFKGYTAKINKAVSAGTVTESADGTAQLGKLTVNGEFAITCKMPKGYNLQVVNMKGTSIIASILPDNQNRPLMYLSIAYDDTYANVERMNDLSDEQLAILENSFTDLNQVEITYSETGHGTKLLIAREVGSDTDFVDILAIYRGYFIEFNMTPGPHAVNQTLTDKQIQMCVDFLTDVDFTPLQK